MSNEVEITVVTSGEEKAKGALKTVQNEGTKAAESINNIGTTARGILSADIIGQIGDAARAGFTSATTAASDLGESMNAVDKIFGESAEQIKRWGEEQANAYGLSQRAFQQMAVPIGASLKNVGIEINNVARLTTMLTERAADMGSVFNQDVAMVLEDIQAGLRGEADPLEKYGVGLSAAAVEQQALADTGKKVASTLTDQEIMLARVNLLMKQTESTTGDFKDTADGYANAQRIANAQIEEAQAKLGEALLPTLSAVAKAVGTVAEGFGSLPGPIQTTIAVVFALGAAFVFLGPKVVAAKDAFRELSSGLKDADGHFTKTTRTLGKAAAAIMAVSAAGHALGAAFGGDTAKNVEIIEEDFRILGDTFGTKLESAVENFADTWTGLAPLFDNTTIKARERFAALDQQLAKMVEEGNASKASDMFIALSIRAQEAGKTSEELAALLPEYAAAQQKAGKETTETKTALEGQVIALKDLETALRKQTDPMFALIEAQKGMKDAQEEYNEAVEKHGKKSPEAEEALRNMAKAAIELSGATAQAQGTFNGQLTPAMKTVLSQAGLTTNQINALEQQFRNAAAAGNAFAKNYTATVTIQTRFEGRAVPVSIEFQSGIGGRQHGGLGTGTVMAGEGGVPELVDLGTGGKVYNGNQTRNIMDAIANGHTGFGAPAEVNVNFNFDGADQAFATFFRRFIDIEANGDVTNLNTNV